VNTLIELPPSAEKLLGKLLRDREATLSEVEELIGELAGEALNRLAEEGLAKVEGDRVVLTRAGEWLLEEDPLGPPILLSIRSGEVTLHKPLTAQRKKLEREGARTAQGYVLKAERPPRREVDLREQLREAWNLLQQGKTRYAALKTYQLAKKLKSKALNEAKKNLTKPTPQKTAEILARIQRELSSKNIGKGK